MLRGGGRRSNRSYSPGFKENALSIVRERYHDLGPTLAAEKLAEEHQVFLSKETLRQWVIEAGLWTTRRERARKVHQPRYRRDCLGELIQIDGSEHWWFETPGAEVHPPRLHRRADNRRRHPRPHRPQRPPHNLDGRLHAKSQGTTELDQRAKNRETDHQTLTSHRPALGTGAVRSFPDRCPQFIGITVRNHRNPQRNASQALECFAKQSKQLWANYNRAEGQANNQGRPPPNPSPGRTPQPS